MTSYPTLLLVHGAWHSPSCFHKIIPALEQNGFKCIAPQLPSSGHEPPVLSNELDIHVLQELIKAELEQANDVVLIGHSYGGVASCSAARGLTNKNPVLLPAGAKGRVSGLIQISSLLLPTGVAPLDANNEQFPPFIRPNYETGWCEPAKPLSPILYNDIAEDEADECIKALRKFSLYTHTSGAGIYAGWMDVPVFYLKCLNDQAIPISLQETMLAHLLQQGAHLEVGEVASGHSPFLSKPHDVVKIVRDAVVRMTKV